jgi:hypothetical protein
MRKPGAESAVTIFFPFIFRCSAVTKELRVDAVSPVQPVQSSTKPDKEVQSGTGSRVARHQYECKQSLCQIKVGATTRAYEPHFDDSAIVVKNCVSAVVTPTDFAAQWIAAQ